jgi:hypothetical protein
MNTVGIGVLVAMFPSLGARFGRRSFSMRCLDYNFLDLVFPLFSTFFGLGYFRGCGNFNGLRRRIRLKRTSEEFNVEILSYNIVFED